MKRMAIVSGICCTDVQADQTPGGKSRSRFTVVFEILVDSLDFVPGDTKKATDAGADSKEAE